MKEFRFEVRSEKTYIFEIKANNQKEAIEIYRNRYNEFLIDDNLESANDAFDLYQTGNY